MRVSRWLVVVTTFACSRTVGDPPATPHAPVALAHEIFKELVEIDTTESNGDTAKAAHAAAARLLAAGFPAADVAVFEPASKRGNLVARLRGTGAQKPILLVAHLDVVEAKRADWTTDPFKLVEKDGYLYGRGTGDDKFMAAAWLASMIEWKRDGFRPNRDLVVVLETDEELGAATQAGMTWLLANHRDLLDAAFAINEGGGVAVKAGKPVWNSLQTAEKVFQTFTLEVTNKGGHSSQPRKDNAIYELAEALVKLEQLAFPVLLNDTTRNYFAKMATIEHGQLAADMIEALAAHPDPAAIARLSDLPFYNAQLRTTCVATRLDAGHADNALPQLARATINCRLVPGDKVEDVQAKLVATIGDPNVAIALLDRDVASEPSPLDKQLVAAVEQLTRKFWPGIPVVPTMSSGATDGRFLRNAGIPTYGHTGLAGNILDPRAHGKDERVSVKAFDTGVQYLYELVTMLAR
ncbi:MAG TPA: M20/M25/M40 family metallo-hydrolase [Kofleriaceae bacterium]|jgi:acetylornithine deacetylase/succinyl-diaminopimelate desuccinylase-like protein|nr:M20/M25/M40 family metallo-hydrolase [Kofleriaceae bacterium]